MHAPILARPTSPGEPIPVAPRPLRAALLTSLGLLLGAGLLSTLAGCQAGTDHLATDAPRAQLFEGLGPHTRTITTNSPEARAYFNQALNWMYAFNHDEAIRSFARAAELDHGCAMAWWGIAVCEGPNYNDPVMTDERSAAAWGALKQAEARLDEETPLELALVEALAERYARPWPEDRSALNDAYAAAMGELWAAHPDDSDIGALYAEAMMVRRPWKLYDQQGRPTEDTPKIVATLERVLAADPAHPGANHLYIHAVEPGAEPDRALAAARRLEDLVPGSGHMLHMPSHIYVQTGHWHESIEQNARAMRADEAYLARSAEQGIQHMYMVHNAHMLAYSAMMVGREEDAMHAARAMWDGIPEEMLDSVAPYIDLWMCSVYDVQKRFGRWDDLLAEPAPPESLPITTAVWHAHRAVAHAAKKDFDAARAEQALFRETRASIPEETVFGVDLAHDILEVSEHFVAGEIALQQEKWDEAITHLNKAAKAEDSLGYGEPPQWLQPVRHTLGAVHLEAGRPADAERVYREDLSRWRENGWSLFGLSRALELQGRTDEAAAVRQRHDTVWRHADEPTTTSCTCIPET
jgi:tetratricopeptide (TPR) repeat protein